MVPHKQNIFHEVTAYNAPSRFVILRRKTFYLSMNSSSGKYIATVLFITLSILIGTLIVYFTSPRPNHTCKHIHRRTVTDIKNHRSRPQFVAIGHFDNDNLLDFVVANTGLDNIDIYLGQNNEIFQRYNTYSTGTHSQPCSVVVGDLDDHYGIDIAVANFGTNSIIIFMGMSDGSFIFNQLLSTGSSRPLMIAVADLNNDYRLDIVVLNYGTNSVGIFLAFEDGSFELSMSYSTGYDSLPKSLTIADLNNDNHFDIVVANFGTDNIGLFLGKGNGTFEDQKIYSTGVGSNPSSVAVGDINHDDFSDIIVADSGTNNIRIIFGRREKNLTREVIYSTGLRSHPEFISLHDLNGDHRLDIIAIDSLNDKVYILPGNQDGTFPLLSMYLEDIESSPTSMASADFNNDNRSDILIVNRGGNSVLMLMGYDAELSTSYSTFTAKTLNHPVSIVTGDVNGDDFLDIVGINHYDSAINVFLGYGDGSFTHLTSISTGIDSRTYRVSLNDFNNDYQLDILVLNYDDNSFSVLFGCGNGTFSTVTTYSTELVSNPYLLAVGDVNHDHCLDVVIVCFLTDAIGTFAGDCNGTFKMISIYKFGNGWKPNCIVMDDFNNDQNMDLIITYINSTGTGLFFGDGTGRFSTSQMLDTDSKEWSYIAAGDFNNDNRTDLAVSVSGYNKIQIVLGNGDGTFNTSGTYSLESCQFPGSIVADDFDNGNQSYLAISCADTGNVIILLGDNNAEFSSRSIYSTGTRSFRVSPVLDDFDNDGKLDVAVVDYFGNNIGILMSYYKVDFVSQKKYLTGFSPRPYSVAVADLNNDNISDVVAVYSGTKCLGIRLGFGNGSFGDETTYPMSSNSIPEYVNVGDVNGDGHIDIVIADSQNDNIIISLGNGHGTFENNITYSMDLQASPVCVAIADLNNDKWTDLVVANRGTDNYEVLYGYNYATFILYQTYSVANGSPSSGVAVGDLNNDNRPDIVAVNTMFSNVIISFGDGNGLFINQTTCSTGYRSRPVIVTVTDINNDGCLDIIVSNWGTSSIGIILGHCDGTFQTIIINPTGLSIDLFKIAVGDINNDERLDVIATYFDRGGVAVFVGSGNGSLSLIATYSTHSHSKTRSIALGDLNNDTNVDAVVTYANSDAVGVLLGYGNGSFVSHTTFPLTEGSQAHAVELVDLNKDDQLDIVFTSYDYNGVVILFGLGNGDFAEPIIYSTGDMSNPAYIIVDYFNDDDRLDIAVLCFLNRAFAILFSIGDDDFLLGRKFSARGNIAVPVMVAADFNNDSKLDIAILTGQDGAIDIFLQNGYEPFATPVTFSIGFGSKPYSLAVADFDHDNLSDIVIANCGTNNIMIILSSKINSSTYSTGNDSRPYGVVVGYFDNDKELDIAVINSGSDTVMIFQGYGDGSFRAIGSYPTGTDSAPRSIVAADFNNDDRMDLAIANTGANNVLLLFGLGNGTFGNEKFYSVAYGSHPYSIAVGDFDRDGWMDMAVANFGADYVEILLQPC